MAFNGFCTGNDMRYSSEGVRIPDLKLKIKAPKPSYQIISPQKSYQKITKIDINPTKETFFSKDNIPKWIDISFYIIPLEGGKNIISLHIINTCLISKNPILYEPNLIMYCHENETDLLRLAPFLIDLSVQMKCDIVSFDYLGFGGSSGKPKIHTILSDSEEALKFSTYYLNYKIENIILFGNGIGCMSSIYLASRKNNQNCKSLILCMPVIGQKIIDVMVMRSINCQTLLIMEFDDKEEASTDDIVNFCREIPNEKEWLPIRKRNTEYGNNFFWYYSNSDDYSDDVYYRHRNKFIMKIKEYIYSEEEIMSRKRASSLAGSTTNESNHNLSIIIPEKYPQMSLDKVIKNKININFDEKIHDDIVPNHENINNEKKIKNNRRFDVTEAEINNDEDY